MIKVFEKWDLDCVEIGVVKDGGRLEYFHENKKVADVDAESLVLGGGAPVYDREYSRPAYLDKIEAFDVDTVPVREDLGEVLRTMLKHPNLVSKRWIYEQYDSMVRTNTVSTNMATDAAVIRVKGTGKAIAVTTDCNSAYVYADPYVGAMIAVSEAARNIACTGGVPLAITNCLNFGNPYSTDVYYQFVHAIKGMGEACRKFNTPVTGGNVSFYNQSVYEDRTEPVYPTPTIGMIGLIADQTKVMDISFKDLGDEIYLIGPMKEDLGSSQYLRLIHGVDHSPAPYFDLEDADKLNKAVLNCIENKAIKSAHDLSEGGLLLAILESSLAGKIGCNVSFSGDIRKDAVWFGEGQNRVLVSLAKENKPKFEDAMKHYGLPFVKLGNVGGDSLILGSENLGRISEFSKVIANRLKDIMEGV